MRRWMTVFGLTLLLITVFSATGQEKGKYPAPRFPSYVKPPKSIEDIMPYARATVRQTGGRTPLGLVGKGTTVALVTAPAADEMVLQAIKRAFEERGVDVQIVREHELVGVSRDDALKVIKATHSYTSEHGHMEARRWIMERGVFVDPEVPKAWIKERRPDFYRAMFGREDELPDVVIKIAEKLNEKSVTPKLLEYLDQHSEVKAVFWRPGGETRTRKLLKHHGEKFLGNFIYDNYWEVMNKASTFPGDLWKLIEERVIEPLGWVDRVHVTDPEGTNFTFEVTEKEAEVWALGAYQQAHLYLFPSQASGRFPYSRLEYPSYLKKWIPPILMKVNGVFAGTSNHTGHHPRIEVHVKDGYIKEIKGGGMYGEIWREFLKYPNSNEITYPYLDQPGYWWLHEGALGTSPKFLKRPDQNLAGDNTSERHKSGVIHWGFGLRVQHDPESPTDPKAWVELSKKYGLPKDHWWHVHNLLPTYRVRVRGTKDTWLTLINRGELTALKSPEIRALASRYGDPNEVLSEDWIPHLPGINAPGRYEDYAKDPWKTVFGVIKRVEAGNYEYFYPPVKAKR